MLNRNPTLSDQEISRILSSEFGDIYSIFTPADNPSKRCIEFCDVRHATAAKQVLEGIAAKIPTISEVSPGCFADHIVSARWLSLVLYKVIPAGDISQVSCTRKVHI